MSRSARSLKVAASLLMPNGVDAKTKTTSWLSWDVVSSLHTTWRFPSWQSRWLRTASARYR